MCDHNRMTFTVRDNKLHLQLGNHEAYRKYDVELQPSDAAILQAWLDKNGGQYSLAQTLTSYGLILEF